MSWGRDYAGCQLATAATAQRGRTPLVSVQVVLTGKYRHGTPADSRAALPYLASYAEHHRSERTARIVQAVLTAADGLGTSPLAVALAWVRDRPGVAAPVVGARNAAQLRGSLAAEELELPAEIRAALDDVSGAQEC